MFKFQPREVTAWLHEKLFGLTDDSIQAIGLFGNRLLVRASDGRPYLITTSPSSPYPRICGPCKEYAVAGGYPLDNAAVAAAAFGDLFPHGECHAQSRRRPLLCHCACNIRRIEVRDALRAYPEIVIHLLCLAQGDMDLYDAVFALHAHIMGEENSMPQLWRTQARISGQSYLEVGRGMVRRAVSKRGAHRLLPEYKEVRARVSGAIRSLHDQGAFE